MFHVLIIIEINCANIMYRNNRCEAARGEQENVKFMHIHQNNSGEGSTIEFHSIPSPIPEPSSASCFASSWRNISRVEHMVP